MNFNQQSYLVIAVNVSFFICFTLLLWQFLIHKQWYFVLLSLFFAFACGGGFLLALVIGWQEATNWKIHKLMRWYTGLLVVWFVFATQALIVTMTTETPKVDPKTQAKQRAAARH